MTSVPPHVGLSIVHYDVSSWHGSWPALEQVRESIEEGNHNVFYEQVLELHIVTSTIFYSLDESH